MADTLKILYTGQPAATDTLLYTVPASTTTAVRGIHVANTTGTAATITLGLNSAAALAEANWFLPELSIPPNGTYDWTGLQALEEADTIRALQGTATALTVHISGIEIA